MPAPLTNRQSSLNANKNNQQDHRSTSASHNNYPEEDVSQTFSPPIKPRQSPQILPPSVDLVSVKPLLCQPKDLIPSSTIKHVYPEIWDVDTVDGLYDYSNSKNQSRHDISNLNKKNLNRKYEYDVGNLQQRSSYGDFGSLCYSRFGKINKTDSIWRPTVSPSAITHNQTKCVLNKNEGPYLQFDSRFQSGNLLQAYCSSSSDNSPSTYTLILQNDTNTSGYNQWFYFKVKACQPYETYRFQIVNMRKNYSLFSKGMKIAVFSEFLFNKEGKTWHRGGNNIEYSSNNICSQLSCGDPGMFTLGWEYTFEDTSSWVYFAYSYPYTYSQLRSYLKQNPKLQISKISQTLMKNNIYAIILPETHESKNGRASLPLVRSSDKKNRSMISDKKPEKVYEIGTKQFKSKKQRMELQNKSLIESFEVQRCDKPLPINKSKQFLTLLSPRKNVHSTSNQGLTITPSTKKEQMIGLPSKELSNAAVKRYRQDLQTKFYRQRIQIKFSKPIEYESVQISQDYSQLVGLPTPKLINPCGKQKNQQSHSSQSTVKQLSKSVQTEDRDILLIMGRAHPGESVSSHVARGLIEQLLTQSPEALYLRSSLKIIIIPMLNPDGVIHGNTRTSLSGNDLNRRWSNPSPNKHPQIYGVKKLLESLTRSQKLFTMIDLHAHTGKESAFFYGCCDRENYFKHQDVRLLNSLQGEIDSQNFNPQFSNNYVGRGRASTARVAFYQEFQAFSYTLQSSFLGPHGSPLHSSVKDYENIGQRLVRSLAIFRNALYPSLTKSSPTLSLSSLTYNNKQDSQKIKCLLKDFREHKNKLANMSKKNALKMIMKEFNQDQGKSDGSSSCPSDCNYDEQFLNKEVFDGDQSAQDKRPKGKKKRNDRLLSIDRTRNFRDEDELCKCSKSKRNLSLKNAPRNHRDQHTQRGQRRSIINPSQQKKFPALILPRKYQLEIKDLTLATSVNTTIANSFFQAFNFKKMKKPTAACKSKMKSVVVMDSLE